ncbi:endogenous inhibitor of DNA gyrase (YacG/DUF329 family) [Methylopila capsulata]|uniref:DNA gyrase inhibitor YacG n=1 Tax=Methylopila capsulata TaxID=61654 RepID=A0A9W6IV43_9HYPH|nr:DNA gyrase inhibitor YacG [Methylopila capsulata]MBM7852911.1 endogenous inhibitor of DNA gyrase (YacG/DUF329 family) [Methylopila capsulata]GLK57122.1 hypothetical protein GCM10008170_31410 [Methylopila capsulata]
MSDASTPPGDTPPAEPRPSPRPCPICKKMSLPDYHPFCSKRCADIDLSRWFKGVYAVPTAESEEIERPADDDEDA